ncbi:TIGR04255 family protein [Variovorax sp. CCNWLW186]|uniref:TIGR04255 family protein n=1 Tax=Variovorax sp. CCNWLW186 TaxID=3127473 RepID=UPI003077229F
MEKPTGLGRWPNAPLAYLTAEIKFQRVLDFEVQLPALTAHLSDRYPLEESSSALEIGGPGSSPSMEPLRDFKNFTSTMGVRLARGSLSLHCTDYAGSGSFQSQWFQLLDLLADLLKPRVLLRSSLRCVDLLVPQGDELPDHYLVPSLRPWREGSKVLGDFEQGNTVSRFKYQDISTTVLILARIKGQFVLPPTLAAMSLAFSPVQAKALQFHQSTGRPFAIMDTDVAHEAARPFDLEALKAQFKQIHQLASASFRAATTEEAQRFWQTP